MIRDGRIRVMGGLAAAVGMATVVLAACSQGDEEVTPLPLADVSPPVLQMAGSGPAEGPPFNARGPIRISLSSTGVDPDEVRLTLWEVVNGGRELRIETYSPFEGVGVPVPDFTISWARPPDSDVMFEIPPGRYQLGVGVPAGVEWSLSVWGD